MIDPIHSLAFALQSNRGIYAVLLGSGVSRSAGILTGWEITLDLIQKVAVLQGETVVSKPESWYQEKFGKEPDYSELLENLAKTAVERQQLLRSYWEPNEEEREEGKKQPTAAHHAIAALVERGLVKVIITTNFDSLIESALREQSIVPKIISTPDHVQGMLPLIHTECCVFKIHGDYLDSRILNTPNELASYPHEFNRLLDRIFDEFGLIVCGWSAEWDGALREAIFRTPSRRFTTYWTARGELSDEARRLVEHRDAQVISIEDADTFFQTIHGFVDALEKFSKPHPLTTEVAVANLKRYLSEPRYHIQLTDLVIETTNRVVESTSGEAFSVSGLPTKESLTERMLAYEAICSTLLAMAAVGGYWVKQDQYRIWQDTLICLSERNHSGGYVSWLALQQYPGTLLLYSLGLGAVAKDRFEFLREFFLTPIRQQNSVDRLAVEFLSPSRLYSELRAEFTENEIFLNNRLHKELKKYTTQLIPNDDRYSLIFDKLEILMALNCKYSCGWYSVGRFAYQFQNTKNFFQEIKESISWLQDKSPFVQCGIFGKSAQECNQRLDELKQFIAGLTPFNKTLMNF